MKLLQKFKSRQADMKRLSAVIDNSLERAALAGDEIAGAHHLALAVFAMDDGLAEQVMADLGSSGDAFADALASLDAMTLSELGIEVDGVNLDSGPVPAKRLAKTDATYEAAIKATYDVHNAGHHQPLTGAHLLAGIASVGVGVAARVFSSLGLDRAEIIAAASKR